MRRKIAYDEFILSMWHIQGERERESFRKSPSCRIIKLISNRTIRDLSLFMSPFQPVDFRCGIIRLTALPISLSTIDTRRLLRWKSMSIIAQWLPAVSVLPSSLLPFSLLFLFFVFRLQTTFRNDMWSRTYDAVLHRAKLILIYLS